MSLSPADIAILKQAKTQGKTKEQAIAALASSRVQTQEEQPTQNTRPFINKVTDFLGLGGATKTFGDVLARQGIGTDTPKEITRANITAPTAGQITGAALQSAAIPAGLALTGGTSLLGQVAVGAGLGYTYDVGADLIEQKSASEVAMPGAGTALGAFAPLAIKGAGVAIGSLTPAARQATQSAVSSVPQAAPAVSGVRQIATEVAERVPRAIERGRTAVQESAERAARIQSATPPVRQAIKSGLDEVIDVDLVAAADPQTKQAMRQMINLVEAPKTGFRPQTRPESIAGQVASDQFALVEKQRKAIGKQIGNISDQLSTKTEVEVLPLQRNVRDILRQNNILPHSGGQLIFKTKRLTPSQQKVVQDLYQLATSDETLTPRQIHEFDQMFSKLQREARFKEKIDDIYLTVPTPDGTTEVNIFKAFRDIFSQKLDEVAPDIKPLNREYRTLRNLQDDLEDSIFKSGNFETTSNLDGAEFAQTNLRRLFSDASSAADYRGIYESMDTVSRSLGYQGPRADDLAGFAVQLRKIYPDAVPSTSATGILDGIKQSVLGAGQVDVRDQQKALRLLLEDAGQ